MKIYTVNGRKVWLDKAPEGYEEPKPKKIEKKTSLRRKFSLRQERRRRTKQGRQEATNE